MRLARPATRREAVTTSALEGTYAALDDVLEAEFLEPGEALPTVSEVVNYVRAAESAYQWIKDRPITIGLLRELQKILVEGTPGTPPRPGGCGPSRSSSDSTGAEWRRRVSSRHRQVTNLRRGCKRGNAGSTKPGTFPSSSGWLSPTTSS